MRLAIDQSALLPELALVASAAEARSTTPGLSRLRLQALEGGSLRLTARNLEYSLASKLTAQITEPGGIWLPAKPFLSLMSMLDGEIAIATNQHNHATITAGRSHFRLPGEAADVSAIWRRCPKAQSPFPRRLWRLITRVDFAISEVTGSSTRPQRSSGSPAEY